MDEKQKNYVLAAVGAFLIILIAIAAASMHGGNNKTTTTTPTTTLTTTSTSPTTTSTTTSETTTTTTPQTTEYVTTSLETTTITTATEIVHAYVIPETFSYPIIGEFEEQITARGMSVSKTVYTRKGGVIFDGSTLHLRPFGYDEIVIIPLSMSGIITGAELKVGNARADVPLAMLYFPRDAFKNATIQSFTYDDSGGIIAEYTTKILGREAPGKYYYTDGTVILEMTFPYSYTLDGIIFNITGTYTLTYTGLTGPTSAITTTSEILTTTVVTITQTITTTVSG